LRSEVSADVTVSKAADLESFFEAAQDAQSPHQGSVDERLREVFDKRAFVAPALGVKLDTETHDLTDFRIEVERRSHREAAQWQRAGDGCGLQGPGLELLDGSATVADGAFALEHGE